LLVFRSDPCWFNQIKMTRHDKLQISIIILDDVFIKFTLEGASVFRTILHILAPSIEAVTNT
jgi:hypothetical protein